MKYIACFLFSVFISSISQTVLKISANEKHENVLDEYLNIKVVMAYIIFFISSLITVYAYRFIHLSVGVILEASGYVFVTLLGRAFLKEKVGKRKLIGLIFILLGIVIFSI